MLIKNISLFISAIVLTAYSQSAEAQEIACSAAPKEAIVEVPAAINDLATVICTKYGHFLTGAEGTIWTYPGAMAPALLIAYLDEADNKQLPPEVNHSKYFSAIEVRDIASSEVGGLLSDDGLPPPAADTRTTVIEISATNQDGIEQKAYIFTAGANRWGYLCDPECKPRNTFMVLDMRRPRHGT